MHDIIRKVFPFEVKEISDRVLQFTGSTEELDRDGEVILASGWDLKNYKKNPVFMWAHRYDQPPIGKANKVGIHDGNLTFAIEFADRDTYEFADTIFRLYKGGFLKATSVGFVPKEWEDGDGDKSPMRTYKKQELLELSAVPVPSNPAALISTEEAEREGIDMAILIKAFEDEEKGIIALYDASTKPEETEDYIRIPVKGEEGKHQDHRIRTIDIDKDKGIKALYCGECKKNTTYLFDKEKEWTMESAQEWVEEHGKSIVVYPTDLIFGADTSSIDYTTGGDITEERRKDISQAEIKDEFDYVRTIIEADDLSEDNTASAWDIVRDFMRITGGDIPDDILAKIGAVLNQKNRQALKDAQAKIQSVLDSAESEPEEPEKEAIGADELVKEVALAVKAQLDERMGIVH